MPEIAEVFRIVHFLRLRLVGKKIAEATAIDDPNVFGKVGTTGKDVEAALSGRKVTSAGSQGKYFWITLDKPPHLVMHFGMTGWIHIKGERTAYTNYYKKMKESELDQWPPRFWKFQLKTEGSSPVEVAFTDARRFGRVRLIHCPAADIRKHSPLVENGPDPVVDVDVFTEEFLTEKMRARHVPVKALLLDQAMMSGVGNWVADETLYQAKLHPEQYCDTFSDEEITKLYEAVRYVCQTAVDLLGDSDKFPEHWLFNYRWGKGGKDVASELPNGDKLAFITVGGRTSCYAPAVQKKTGRVPPVAKVEAVKVEEDGEEKVSKKRKSGSVKKSEDGEEKPVKKARGVKVEEDESKPANAGKGKKRGAKAEAEVQVNGETQNRRRSTRLRT